jgi:hypothetical protein
MVVRGALGVFSPDKIKRQETRAGAKRQGMTARDTRQEQRDKSIQ